MQQQRRHSRKIKPKQQVCQTPSATDLNNFWTGQNPKIADIPDPNTNNQRMVGGRYPGSHFINQYFCSVVWLSFPYWIPAAEEGLDPRYLVWADAQRVLHQERRYELHHSQGLEKKLNKKNVELSLSLKYPTFLQRH